MDTKTNTNTKINQSKLRNEENKLDNIFIKNRTRRLKKIED